MAIEQKLELRLSQKLILTPQLQQSIKLLQLPLLELTEDINQELLNNPMLEEGVAGESEPKQETTVGSSEESPYKEPSNDIEAPLEKMFGFTTDNYFEERESDGRDLGYFGDNNEESTAYYERKREKEDLYEHLLWQLRLSNTSEKIGRIAEMIINNLNQDGYLKASLEEIAALTEIDTEAVEEALSFVQEFDPIGVGARDLQECLLLQLKPLNLQGTLVEKILAENFNELELKKFKQLASKFKITIEEIFEAIKIIEGLEPRPGRNFAGDETIHIIPDVYVVESDGNFMK